MIRAVAKGLVERILVSSGMPSIGRRLAPGRVAVLAYHNVVPDAEAGRGDSGLHLPLSRFIEQMEQLRRTHHLVPLETAATPSSDDRPRAVITFDDAYRGAVTLAVPELARRGIPATVFVAPGILGEPSLWWDELGEAGRLTTATRQQAMWTQRGRTATVRRWAFGDAPPPRLPTSYGVATAEELFRHAGGLLGLAAHGWDHAFLPALDADELTRDLVRVLEWLRACPAPTLPWLALPYGAGSDAVTDAALAVGFEALLEISGGRLAPGSPHRIIPRINVPAGLSRQGLDLRASGVIA